MCWLVQCIDDNDRTRSRRARVVVLAVHIRLFKLVLKSESTLYDGSCFRLAKKKQPINSEVNGASSEEVANCY